MRAEMSMLSAVRPVTASVAPVCPWSPGLAARIARTRPSVAALLGPLIGITWTRATLPSWSNVAVET